MTDSLKLAEMQRTSIEFERQRHLANWFIKSSPHMATPANTAAATAATTTTAASLSTTHTTTTTTANTKLDAHNTTTTNTVSDGATTTTTTATATAGNGTTGHGTTAPTATTANNSYHNTPTATASHSAGVGKHIGSGSGGGVGIGSGINNLGHSAAAAAAAANSNPVFFLMSSNGNTGAVHHHALAHTPHPHAHPHVYPQSSQQQQQQQQHNGKHAGASVTVTPAPASMAAALGGAGGALSHLGHVETRKPKLRRFNSHDTSSNMFSVADFENARLARRNEIELNKRLQRRMRMSANGCSGGVGGGGNNGALNTHPMGCSSGAGVGAGGNGSAMIGIGSNSLNFGNGSGAAGAFLSGSGACGSLGGSGSGDYSTGDSKTSKYSNESQHEPLRADLFLERYSLPRVVRISYKTKFCDETLQSSSSNGSSTVTSHSSTSGNNNNNNNNSNDTNHNSSSSGNTGTSSSSTVSSSGGGGVGVSGHLNGNTNNTGGSGSSSKQPTQQQPHVMASPSNSANIEQQQQQQQQQDHGELFLLYRLVRQRHIYHGHNAKTASASRKKGVLIPQEFPGYFSMLNDKGLPTATLYTTLLQLVRERVCKFVSVYNMPAFMESQPNASGSAATPDSCMPLYSAPVSASNRPQYVKTTARGGQVYRLLAVFEDGKQDHNAIGNAPVGCAGGMGASLSAKASASHGREKEKGRYAQLLNENRQVLYVSLSTKGKFYEIEPGIPQILQKLSSMTGGDANKKLNPDCVHRITALVTPVKELPLTLRYISGPNGCAGAIPEHLCITRISTENVVIACPIEDVEAQSPLHLRKLHLTKEMNLLKSSLGFESEQRMLANPNVQNILKFCQFNCDQFLKMVEVEILSRPERSGSKSRVEGLRILKPLHLPKLLRREKTTISAHEKEDSIIFLTKSDLANLEAKDHTATVSPAASGQQSLDTLGHGSANRISEKMKVFQSTKKRWFRRQDKHAVSSLTSLDLDMQAKRLSMERYSDMSKLLQERFGDKPNNGTQENESVSEPSGASDIGCSDTETTTLATIEEKFKQYSHGHSTKSKDTLLQKSMSLQDIELIGGKPDLLPADTISEAGTDIEDIENRAPVPAQQSFITEKLYNEFHVKTRQYSKSSSSLHQLLNFSLPQKFEAKRSLAQIKQSTGSSKPPERRFDFNVGEPVTGRRAAGGVSLLAGAAAILNGNSNAIGASQNTSLASPLTPTSLIEDDLPYSSVRDSLVLSSDEDHPTSGGAGHICQALHLIDYTKENIYAEICHDASAMGGIPSSQTRDTFSGDTHSTQISDPDADDYGDYASLTYPTPPAQQNGGHGSVAIGVGGAGYSSSGLGVGHAISRVQINCSSSPVSYHTVYLGDEPLGEQHAEQRRRQRDVTRVRSSRDSSAHSHSRDRAHITTVDVQGGNATHVPHTTLGANTQLVGVSEEGVGIGVGVGVDNIYNTLK